MAQSQSVRQLIRRMNRVEFVGQLIDIFEDFLEARGVTLDNPERDTDPDAAIIYGNDYAQLQSAIEDTLQNWGLISNS